MAGIGFELRKLLQQDSYFGLLRAYTYAGIIAAGPWILSITGLIAIGVFSLSVVVPDRRITEFHVTVTWIMALSLILTGPLQLSFTRWVADQLFAKRDALVLPNFSGALLLVQIAAGALGIPLFACGLGEASALYRATAISGFVVASDIWIATIFLSGLKEYRAIVALFGLGYGVSVAAAMWMRWLGAEGLLLGWVIGQTLMLIGMLVLVARRFRAERLVAFDFLRPGAMFTALIWIGLMYNASIWADKFVFWLHPSTGEQVLGLLHASPIYDLPIFLAYLSIVPGMAVFLMRFETDFVEAYDAFYDGVRSGASLGQIAMLRDAMALSIRGGLGDIVKVQAITLLAMAAFAPTVFAWFHIPSLHLPLFYVDSVAASFQVLLLAVMNVLFYLDRRRENILLMAVLLLLVPLLSLASLGFGARFFGYGFALALLLTLMLGLLLVNRVMSRLEYETFMLQ
jgi:uncharacterized membrane protein